MTRMTRPTGTGSARRTGASLLFVLAMGSGAAAFTLVDQSCDGCYPAVSFTYAMTWANPANAWSVGNTMNFVGGAGTCDQYKAMKAYLRSAA